MREKRVDFEREAIAEANDAYNWYADRSAAAAEAFVAAIERAVEMLAKYPKIGTVGSLRTRKCFLAA